VSTRPSQPGPDPSGAESGVPEGGPLWPYAVAFGTGAAWAQLLAAADGAPAWFRAAESRRPAVNEAFVAFAGHSASSGADAYAVHGSGAASGAAAGGGSSSAS